MFWTSRLASLLCHLRASHDCNDGFVLHTAQQWLSVLTVLVYGWFILNTHRRLAADTGKQANIVVVSVVAVYFFPNLYISELL